jgi:hypothetical protein
MDKCNICDKNDSMSVTLDCNHTFCFLCLKTNIKKQSECPSCKKKININLQNTTINDINYSLKITNNIWLYCSIYQNDWWMYDSNVSNSIETSYKSYICKKEISTPNTLSNKTFTFNQINIEDGNNEKEKENEDDNYYLLNTHEFKIGSNFYIIDFDTMTQYPKNDITKKRHVKRINVINNDPICLKKEYNIQGVSGVKF